jgi:hypothetical protein
LIWRRSNPLVVCGFWSFSFILKNSGFLTGQFSSVRFSVRWKSLLRQSFLVFPSFRVYNLFFSTYTSLSRFSHVHFNKMGAGQSSQVEIKTLIEQNRMLMNTLTTIMSQRWTEINGEANTAQTGGFSWNDNRVDSSETRIGTNFEGEVTIHNYDKTTTGSLIGPELQISGEEEDGSGSVTKMPTFARRTALESFTGFQDDTFWTQLSLDWDEPVLPAQPRVVNVLLCVSAGLAFTLLAVLATWFTVSRRRRHQLRA